ncbi:hypothetical protein FGO68_gene1152 [Halteria grandinella]|uniref:Uncharacterized protein n=1 Tax=Halteria grandinella TaxID=5974 RepID=A0A8J8T1E0_HALGN|nr:hypothetical protein FGO68_gene1152 [Halteria grandinella]
MTSQNQTPEDLQLDTVQFKHRLRLHSESKLQEFAAQLEEIQEHDDEDRENATSGQHCSDESKVSTWNNLVTLGLKRNTQQQRYYCRFSRYISNSQVLIIFGIIAFSLYPLIVKEIQKASKITFLETSIMQGCLSFLGYGIRILASQFYRKPENIGQHCFKLKNTLLSLLSAFGYILILASLFLLEPLHGIFLCSQFTLILTLFQICSLFTLMALCTSLYGFYLILQEQKIQQTYGKATLLLIEVFIRQRDFYIAGILFGLAGLILIQFQPTSPDRFKLGMYVSLFQAIISTFLLYGFGAVPRITLFSIEEILLLILTVLYLLLISEIRHVLKEKQHLIFMGKAANLVSLAFIVCLMGEGEKISTQYFIAIILLNLDGICEVSGACIFWIHNFITSPKCTLSTQSSISSNHNSKDLSYQSQMTEERNHESDEDLHKPLLNH